MKYKHALPHPIKEEIPAPTLVRVYRIGPDGVTSTLRGSAGLATAAQIKAMDEAAKGTGYRYTAWALLCHWLS